MLYETDLPDSPPAPSALLEMLPCGLILLDSELAVEGFNEDSSEFFRESCTLFNGMEFDELVGALRDMAVSDGFGEAEVLAGHMRAFEECTVDYRRFDGKHYRISAKPLFRDGFSNLQARRANNRKETFADYSAFRIPHSEFTGSARIGMSLLIADISDIMESEYVLAKRGMELENQRSALSSRLRLADALVSEREARRLGKQFAGRMSALLDRLEDELKRGNTGACLIELEKQREYVSLLASGGVRSEFAERLKKSLCPPENDIAPHLVFHHIAAPRCGEILERDIIEAAREGVMLIAVCGAAGVVHISLSAFDGGMELNIRSDEPVVPDYENAEAYMRLKKNVKKMRGDLKTDTSNGFDLRLRCVFPIKAELPVALVALADSGIVNGVCETLGGGAEPILRCIAAAPDIDLRKACQRYTPSVLIAEPGLIEKYARILKQLNSTLKIIAISAPGTHASSAALLYLNGYLTRDIKPEGLRVAINGIMRGFKVWTDGNPLEGVEEAAKRYGLSEVEQSIIGMTGQGMSSGQIAATLHYSQGSLRNMFSAIYVKLGLSGKAQLTAFAILNGFADR